MKNFKTFYKTLTASRLKEIRESFTPPHTPLHHHHHHQIKASYVSGTNIFLRRYTGIHRIYRHLLSKSFEKGVRGRCCGSIFFFNVELVEVLFRLTTVADICAQILPSLHSKKASYVPKIAKCDMQLVGLF